MSFFKNLSGFCPDCGSILPPIGPRGEIKCYLCSKTFIPEEFGEDKVTYTIYFNSRENYKRDTDENTKQEDEEEGPVVERKCPKCGCERMSYATLQLRSADEGQTVFYTCTKCKYKESENS